MVEIETHRLTNMRDPIEATHIYTDYALAHVTKSDHALDYVAESQPPD